MKEEIKIWIIGIISSLIGAIILSLKFDGITYLGLCLFWFSSILISYIFKKNNKNSEEKEE